MKSHNTTTTTPTTNLAPDYPDEASARAAGWQPITTAFSLPQEQDLALSVAATLRGTAPGSCAVPVAIIGTESRIQFARRVEDLRAVADDTLAQAA